MKTCCDCQIRKPFSKFVPKPSCKDGYELRCRACRAIRYNKNDPRRILAVIYERQVSHSIERGHPAPAYDLEQLAVWMHNQPHREGIWLAYVASGYQTALKPSIDRIDDNRPYVLDNLQLMTWGENRKKGALAKKAGLLNANQRRVMSLSLDGMPMNTYHSIMDAVRDVKGHMSGISSVANGVPIKKCDGSSYTPRTYKGRLWKWV